MAGIAGIILKEKKHGIAYYAKAFSSMHEKLSFSDDQLKQSYIAENAIFGNVVTISSKRNDYFIYNTELHLHCIIDGQIYINSNEKSIITDKYNIHKKLLDCELIPYLYDYYQTDIVNHLTGWYNIFIYNSKNNKAILFNDRLGYLPLYFYSSNTIFLFASKIEAILASGILPKIEFDSTTISEHLIFNYPLSDHTYIRKVLTLPNASIIPFEDHKNKVKRYWDIGELFGEKPLSKEDSFHILNESLANTLKKVASKYDKFNLSLTGGWDSRVILSYLIPEYKEKLNLYSFGAENSDDITIPHYISKKEGLNYTAYILNDEYLQKDFIPTAKQTIDLSNGTRNYKRTHYLHTIKQISEISDVIVSGIFGDEVFKVGRPSGGTVLSKHSISLIDNNFDPGETIKSFFADPLSASIRSDHSIIKDELRQRMEIIKDSMNKYETSGQKYYSFRFEYNLRKYFGNELNSYNDFAICFSPYIDYDFLKSFSQTKNFGANYSFNTKSISLKRQSSLLYYKLTKENYSPLTYYQSSRGYSMKDTSTILGNFNILLNKYLGKKSRMFDGFNTNSTSRLFYNTMSIEAPSQLLFRSIEPEEFMSQDINSLIFWMNSIQSKY